MKMFLSIALIALAAVGQQVASRIYGDVGGSVQLPGLDTRLRPYVFDLSWKGGDCQGGMFPEKDGVQHWRLLPHGRHDPKIEGTLRVSPGENDSAHLEWTFSPDADMELNEVGVSATFSYTMFRGGHVVLVGDDGKDRVVPLPEKKPVNSRLACQKATQVKVCDSNGVPCASFAFGVPQGVLVQDGRAWRTEAVSLRFALPRATPFRKGAVRRLSLEYRSPHEFKVGRPAPIQITAGRNWIPMMPGGDIQDGSALDFSKIRGTDCPAGKYGRVVAVGPNFEFEKQPGVSQRFYGVNLCRDANLPPTYELSRKFAEQLRKTGYNAIRFHHHESDLVKDMNDPSATTLNPESMKRFDGLVAACVENGIYMSTDLYVSRRPISWRSIGVDRDGMLEMRDAKSWLLVHEGMQSNLFAFVRNWLGHVNEFTGRRLADEPALAWISLVNEAAQGNNVDYLVRQEPWVAAWKVWLAAKKTSDPVFYGEIDESFPTTTNGEKGRKSQAFVLFLQETESAFAAKVTTFLREDLHCKALLTNLNGCWFPIAYQYCKEVDYDYVDDHFYVDHPKFLDRPWSLPSASPNVNPLANDRLGVQDMVNRRVLNRPFTCTEYNYSGPGRFRGVGGIATGALGALQGWGGLWRFAWSHGLVGVVSPHEKKLEYFDMSGDPLGLASERASICLFLRRDLAELEKTYAVHLPRDLVRKPNPDFGRRVTTPHTWAGWYAKLGTLLGETAPTNMISAGTYPDVHEKTREEVFADLRLRPPEDGDFPRAGDGAIRVDRDTGMFTIITPRTCGGFAEEGTIRARSLVARLEEAPATVWASSLDGWPLDVSSRILVTHLTDVQNNGITYADEDLRVLLKWGGLPHLMRNGRAFCSLRLSEGKWKVYALSPSGERRFMVPCRFQKNRLEFTADVDVDPTGATYLYELVRE